MIKTPPLSKKKKKIAIVSLVSRINSSSKQPGDPSEVNVLQDTGMKSSPGTFRVYIKACQVTVLLGHHDSLLS